MIKRFFLPHRTRRTQEPVDAVSRCALHALQDVDQRKWPAILISKRCQQHMNVIRHDYHSMKMNPGLCGAGALACQWLPSGLSQRVAQNQIASRFGQDSACACAEGDEHGGIFFLEMWK